MSECSHQAAYEQSEDTWYCPYCESIISWEIEGGRDTGYN